MMMTNNDTTTTKGRFSWQIRKLTPYNNRLNKEYLYLIMDTVLPEEAISGNRSYYALILSEHHGSYMETIRLTEAYIEGVLSEV